MNVTWIVLADSHHGRIYARSGQRAPLRLVESLDHPEGKVWARDLVTDRPGVRKGDGTLLSGHSTVPHTPREEVEERRFAHEVARRLEKGRAVGEFEKLVLVMPARTYGEVWGELDAATRAKVTLHLAHDLLQLSEPQIEERVLEALGEEPLQKRATRTWAGGRLS